MFEGIWRKYYVLLNVIIYLEECIWVFKEVMNKYIILYFNYEEFFNLEFLVGINGIILYKEYVIS